VEEISDFINDGDGAHITDTLVEEYFDFIDGDSGSQSQESGNDNTEISLNLTPLDPLAPEPCLH
jgi:hypothetical protein